MRTLSLATLSRNLARKECSKCGAVKSLAEFYPRKDASSGHHNQCKDCKCAQMKVFRDDRRMEQAPKTVSWELLPKLPPITPHERAWKKSAACNGQLDKFFNISSMKPGTKGYEELQAICDGCGVRGECRALIDLIEQGDGDSPSTTYCYGFWAGELPIERVRRRFAAAGLKAPHWPVRGV